MSGLLEPLLSSRLMYTQLCRYVDPYAQAQAQAQAQARALENKTEEEKEEIGRSEDLAYCVGRRRRLRREKEKIEKER